MGFILELAILRTPAENSRNMAWGHTNHHNQSRVLEMSSLTLQKHFLVWVRVTSSRLRKEEGRASIMEVYTLQERIHQDLYLPASQLNFISNQ